MAKIRWLIMLALAITACQSLERKQDSSRIKAGSTTDIGPHDEPLRVTFVKGKGLAREMVAGFHPDLAELQLPNRDGAMDDTVDLRTDEVLAWLRKNHENLLKEVSQSPLHYLNTEAVVCAATGLQSLSPIIVFVDACLSNSRPSVLGAAKLIIHENVHHFGFKGDAGEWFADSVAGLIVDAWINGGEIPPVPLSQHWTLLTLEQAPAARIDPIVLWLGNSDKDLEQDEGLFVWGGRLDDFSLGPLELVEPRNDGGFYLEKIKKWQPVTKENVPTPRVKPAFVAMGHRAFIWGGAAMTASKSLPEVFHYPKIYGDGKSYDPRTDRWFEITDRGAPSPRYAASAIWTGKEVIVWGGAWTKAENSNETQKVYADGAIYDPEQGTWRPLSGKGAPSARYLHAAVWTGQEMIIWGGASVTVTDTGEQDEFLMLTDGAIYNPQMDTWRPMPAPPHRKGRIDFSAVWSGSELIIYGGLRDSQDMTVDPITDERHYCHGDGFAFQPKTNQWRNLSAGGSPGPLCAHAGVWTGESMLIWGGYRKHARAKERSGYNYDPATDRWNQLGLQNSPEGDYVFASPSYDGKVHFWGGSWQKFAFANIDGVESRVLAPGAGYVLNP